MSTVKEVFDFLKKCQMYYLVTREDHHEKTTPFGEINIFEQKLYIKLSHKSNVARLIPADSIVQINAIINAHEWIRIHATLVEDPRLEPRLSMNAAYPLFRSASKSNNDNIQIFYLKDAEALIADINNNVRFTRIRF